MKAGGRRVTPAPQRSASTPSSALSPAGPELWQALNSFRGCPTGSAVLTPAFRLSAKYVIHAVGPVWHGGNAAEAGLLESAYRSAFQVALDHGDISEKAVGLRSSVIGTA